MSDEKFDGYVIKKFIKRDNIKVIKVVEKNQCLFTSSNGNEADMSTFKYAETDNRYVVFKTLQHNIPSIEIKKDTAP